MNILWPFIRLFRKQLAWLSLGMLLNLITIMAGVGLLSLSGWFISAAAFSGLSYAVASQFNYMLPSAGVRFFSLARILGRYGERVVSHEATFKLLTHIRVWLYEKLEPLAPAHLLKYQSGDLLGRFGQDVDAIDNLYIRILAPTLVLIVVMVLAFYLAQFLSVLIAWVVFLGLFLAAFIVPPLMAWLARHNSRQLAADQTLLKQQVVSHFQGLAEAAVFGQLDVEQRHLEATQADLLKTQAKASVFAGLGDALVQIVLGACLLSVVAIMVSLVHHGSLRGALIALAALGVMAVFEAVGPLPVAYQYLAKTTAAARRILQLVEQKPVVQYTEHAQQAVTHYAIEFDNIRFNYPGADALFNGYSLSIQQGEHLAIVAQSGAGKTTLLQLLARFWDVSSGAIRLGGIDIRELTEMQLRQSMAFVNQSSHIFNTSILDNCRLGNPEATEEAIWQALALAELKPFVETLPQGLNTWVGEQGQALSGGQQKRLAIARALLKPAPILILDEPTTGLDTATATRLLETITNHYQGKTFIMITHDESLCRFVNRVENLGV